MQTARVLSQDVDPSMKDIALRLCQKFEAVERWRGDPAAVLPAQTAFGVACLFIPREERYIRWCREKLANIERLG